MERNKKVHIAQDLPPPSPDRQTVWRQVRSAAEGGSRQPTTKQCHNKLTDTQQTQQVEPNDRVPLMNDLYIKGLTTSVRVCIFSAGKTLPDTARLVSYLWGWCVVKLFGADGRGGKKEMERTSLTKQVNVFMWKTKSERSEMLKFEPAGNISPGKLMRDKYLHADVTVHSCTKEQTLRCAFGVRACKISCSLEGIFAGSALQTPRWLDSVYLSRPRLAVAWPVCKAAAAIADFTFRSISYFNLIQPLFCPHRTPVVYLYD